MSGSRRWTQKFAERDGLIEIEVCEREREIKKDQADDNSKQQQKIPNYSWNEWTQNTDKKKTCRGSKIHILKWNILSGKGMNTHTLTH